MGWVELASVICAGRGVWWIGLVLMVSGASVACALVAFGARACAGSVIGLGGVGSRTGVCEGGVLVAECSMSSVR